MVRLLFGGWFGILTGSPQNHRFYASKNEAPMVSEDLTFATINTAVRVTYIDDINIVQRPIVSFISGRTILIKFESFAKMLNQN